MTEKRGREPVQLSMFGPGLLNTVELTELYGSEPGGVFEFLGTDLKSTIVKTCYGDLIVMINTLEDYARILAETVVEQETEGLRKHIFLLHGARCRKIARYYAEAIGYDYDAAIRGCAKRRVDRSDDIGEDALTLIAKANKPKEGD